MKRMQDSGQVFAAWRPPFAEKQATVHAFAPGSTVLDLIEAMPGLPVDFAKRGVVAIGGHEIVRRHWRRVKPKPGQMVTLHYALQNGGGGRSGGGGGKNGFLGFIVAFAAVALSVFTLGGGLALLGGPFAAGGLLGFGSVGLKLLSAGISIGGSLLAAALTPPPIRPEGPKRPADQNGPASISGNVLAPGAPIPRVIGDPGRRVFPPLGAQPLVERIGDNEFAEAVFVLAGPHKLSDIRLGDTAIEDAEDIEYQVREGWDDDQPADLVSRFAVTKTPGLEISAPQVQPDAQSRLENQNDPTKSLSRWHSVSSSAGADRIWLHVTMPEGLRLGGSETMTMPFRIRMRAGKDDPWINLPEIQFSSNDVREIRLAVELVWEDGPEVNATVPEKSGWTAAYKQVAGQSAPDPTSDDWVADASFSAGAGSNALYRGNEGASNVRRVTLAGTKATIHLDETAIPRGRYEVQIKRGVAFKYADYSKISHTYSGSARDFFHYVNSSTPSIVQTRENVADRAYLVRVSSVFDRHPIKGGDTGSGLAVIAIKARNRQIENLSVLAAGYVRDWDGSAWQEWKTTNNPAPHYRDVLRGPLTPDPLDDELIDDVSLLDWRTACIDKGYTVDMICEGDPIDEVLSKIAGCGYARPRASETWGVIRDYDRSAEEPVQIFSQRNSADLSMAKAFARLPDAFRVVYHDGEDDDAEAQVIVWRRGRAAVVNPRLEEIRYEGIRIGAAAIARGEYDLAQAELRSAFWSFRAPAEAIRCTRGDLIGINHDVIDQTHGSGRIVDVEIDDGNVVAITLDAEMPVYGEPDMLQVVDMLEVDDLLLVGATTAANIRQSNGLFSQHTIAGATGTRRRLEFASPYPIELDDDDEPVIRPDSLVTVGKPGFVSLRLVMAGIDYDADQVARITAVDEAPELWAA